MVRSDFYDNDLTFLPDVLSGSFPTPLRRGVRTKSPRRTSVRWPPSALTDPTSPAAVAAACRGRRRCAAIESAAVWAEALGRAVRYTGDDAEAWEAALCRRIPAGKKRNDWRNSFRALTGIRMGTCSST